MITLSTGREINLLLPVTLLWLTESEYQELLGICRERSKERVA